MMGKKLQYKGICICRNGHSVSEYCKAQEVVTESETMKQIWNVNGSSSEGSAFKIHMQMKIIYHISDN